MNLQKLRKQYNKAQKTRQLHPGTYSYEYYTTKMVKIAHEYNKNKRWYHKPIIPKP